MDVMVGAKGCLELANRFEGLFQIEHRVAAGDTGAGGVHGMSLLDDLVPRRAPAFVGEHVRGFPSVFRQRAVIAAPVAFAGDEQDEFAALLALHATLSLALLRREDFGGHGKLRIRLPPWFRLPV